MLKYESVPQRKLTYQFAIVLNEFYVIFYSTDAEGQRLQSKSIACLVSMIFILEKMFDIEHGYAADYRVGLCRTSTMRPVMMNLPGGWMKKSNKMEKNVNLLLIFIYHA